jgi:hypothetical protein
MTTHDIIENLKETHKAEFYEMYWTPVLDGRRNQALRNDIYRHVYGSDPEKNVNLMDCIDILKMNFNQLNLFDNL